MIGQHRQAVPERSPRALGRTFAPREVADLLRPVGDDTPPGDTAVDAVRPGRPAAARPTTWHRIGVAMQPTRVPA